MGTTRTCEMRTLSSLELMLLKLQQAEEEQQQQPGDAPPALPSRPVMKARLPRARKKLPLNFQNTDFSQQNDVKGSGCFSTSTEKKAFLDSVHQQGDVPNDFSKTVEDEKEGGIVKGVVIIQRCYRGHQACRYYHELKIGAIALQSFVRGENARNRYQCLVRRLRAIVIIQKHTREQHRKRIEQLTAIICLQAGIRGWLARREFAKQIASGEMKNLGNKCELTKVPQIVLLDLGRKVLITEAALERKKDENASLKNRIADFEKKWKQYEARMQNMEKMWQDQLTSIQTSLAAVKRRQAAAGNGSSRLPETSSGRITLSCMLNNPELQVNGRADSNGCPEAHCKTTSDNHAENSTRIQSGQEVSSFCPEDDLAKLKLRFKAWKKDYKNRLQEAKVTMKQLGQPERVKSTKIWCGR